jgi:recombination protein RecR
MFGQFPKNLQQLINHLKKLPGVGSKTAERFGFELLKWKENELTDLATLLSELRSKILSCTTCGCLTQEGVCSFCDSTSRDKSSLCILSSPRDAYAIEETKSFKGHYHVIEHLLSPLDGRYVSTLKVERIVDRITNLGTKEVILAFDSTIEGDATALYLKQQLAPLGVSVTRLAFGLPVGSNLEYVDSGTLSRALQGRQ